MNQKRAEFLRFGAATVGRLALDIGKQLCFFGPGGLRQLIGGVLEGENKGVDDPSLWQGSLRSEATDKHGSGRQT